MTRRPHLRIVIAIAVVYSPLSGLSCRVPFLLLSICGVVTRTLLEPPYQGFLFLVDFISHTYECHL